MSQTPSPVTAAHLRSLALFTAAITPLCVLAFLVASQFFVAWEGRVTGKSPIGTPDPSHWRVVIAREDHTYELRSWPASAVDELEVPIDVLVPPSTVGDAFPYTRKARFQLHYLVEKPDGENLVVPTTSPSSLGVAVLLGLLLIAVRNGYVSGNPIDIRPRPTQLPGAQAPSGQIAPAPSGQKGRFQPPPPRSRGGRRR